MSDEIPVPLRSREAVIEVSTDHKAVQAVSVDTSGSRMVTGGIDGVFKYWDFHGMNGVDPKPFREFIPLPGHSINALSFNSSGSLVLCITSDAKARIFDREGTNRPIEETIKGDQYIRTPENTKGHTHMLSYGQFHPSEASKFMTSSYDSTVRLWDLNTNRIGMSQNIPNLNCFKCVDEKGICGGNRLFVSSAAYSDDGKQIMAGCSDGSIHLFNDKNRYGKGLSIVRKAHIGEVTDLKFLFDDTQMVTRGMDDTIKFWDIRKLKEPTRIWNNIQTTRSLSNMALSPDNQWLIAGTALGDVACISMESGEMGGRQKLMTKQLIRVLWHKSLNQIICTANDGNLFMHYDEELSRGGALSFVNKAAPEKRSEVKTSIAPADVFAYDELLESGDYRENRMGELRPAIRRPETSQYIEPMRYLGKPSKLSQVEDTQKLLLSFEDESSGLVSGAYKRTQPKPVLDYSESRGAVDALLSKKQYCPQCGLKICTCGYMDQSSKRQKM